MNTTHQTLDRTAISTFALAVATLAVAGVMNLPVAAAKQAAVAEALDAVATAPAAEARYKLVVTAQRPSVAAQEGRMKLTITAKRSGEPSQITQVVGTDESRESAQRI